MSINFIRRLIMNLDLESILAESPELAALLSNFGFVSALVTVIAGIILAFCGVKLFRIAITLSGTYLFGTVGNTIVAAFLYENLGEALLELPINVAVLVGFAFAAIGFVLSYKLYKLAIFLFGGAIGYVLGNTVAAMLAANLEGEFFTSEMFPLIVSVVCAILVGIITLFIFKFLYIFVTSFAGMCTAMLSAWLVIAPTTVFLIIFGILALILSIVAMVYQFKHSEDM